MSIDVLKPGQFYGGALAGLSPDLLAGQLMALLAGQLMARPYPLCQTLEQVRACDPRTRGSSTRGELIEVVRGIAWRTQEDRTAPFQQAAHGAAAPPEPRSRDRPSGPPD